MKKHCKNVDIFDLDLVYEAVLNCLSPAKTRQRGDTIRLFAKILKSDKKTAVKVLQDQDTRFYWVASRISHKLINEMKTGSINFPPYSVRTTICPNSGKVRKITILTIKHLLLDHIAVIALRDLSKRIGEFQVSSIKGRGAHYGARFIKRWLRGKKAKYVAKIDIRKYYDSIDQNILFDWLEKHVKNPKLLWLVRTLVTEVTSGLAIGSYLSQNLANLFLSDIYHFALEKCRNKRGKAMISHCVFYLDDMAFFSPNKRNLKRAIEMIIKELAKKKLAIKPNWNVFEITKDRPLDMMGFRFHRGFTTIRKRIFKRLRRSFLRAKRKMFNYKKLSLNAAKSAASYYGYLKATSVHFKNGQTVFEWMFKKISENDLRFNYS